MRLLRDLALLYLAVAQSSDDALSSAELDAVTDTLHHPFDDLDRAEVQNLVMEAMTEHLEAPARNAAARQVVSDLGEGLTGPQQRAVLDDLGRIARADGVLLDSERDLLAAIAEAWHLPHPAPPPASPAAEEDGGALHHLVFLYLLLAHGTDQDLSENERQVIRTRLRAWRPALSDGRIRAVFERALERYAHGATPERVSESVAVVREALPEARRRAAFDDLVQIANADGLFLDSEEDLLNELRSAWDLGTYTGFSDLGGAE